VFCICLYCRSQGVGLRSLTCWDCGFEFRRGHGWLFFVCCEVEVSARDRSLVQRSHTECFVCECDHEASTVRRPWPTRSCRTKKKYALSLCNFRERRKATSPCPTATLNQISSTKHKKNTISSIHKLHINQMHYIFTFYSLTPTYVSAFTRPSSGARNLHLLYIHCCLLLCFVSHVVKFDYHL
jgi:hypothetical protein